LGSWLSNLSFGPAQDGLGDADGAIARPVIEQLSPNERDRILGENARDILLRARSG